MRNLKDISVQYVKGVGPARKKLLSNLGVESVEDLLYLFPRRYEDRRKMVPLAQVKVGEAQVVTGKVSARGGRRSWYTKKHVYETVLDDGKGRLYAVWFNQPYLEHYFKPGVQVVLYGKVEVYKNRLQMVSPEYEIIGEEDKSLSMGRIVPIYPLTRGITQRYLRKVIFSCLQNYRDDLQDILPVGLRNKHRLFNVRRSMENIHYPESPEAQDGAMRRISFEEFFLFQVSVLKRRMSIVTKPGVAHQISPDLPDEFAAALPFALTRAQTRVIKEIAADMRRPSPMLRLLQGDVGSGKTVTALFGCLAAARGGHQSAFMAPTEILARQHHESLTLLLSGLSKAVGSKPVRTALLLGSLKKEDKERVSRQVKAGEVDLVVGTHALLSEGLEFKDLSYLVIDEQHKFGVRQRAVLSAKGRNPDVLVMTATPIPRTLSLTLYGDLDVSVLDELPPGKGKITTKMFPQEKADDVYRTVRGRVEKGQQAYIVYPIIDESEILDLKAAEKMFRRFQKEEFKGIKIGIVHGQMNRQETEAAMDGFKRGDIRLLVATTVLEVGVDAPNANVIVIEHAERFGLSQLHQLRGRVGRGREDGQCFLIANPVTEDSQQRMKAILSTHDGFKIAEQDLKIRGPGHYFGRHQHGLNELRFADPVAQVDILELARREAVELVGRDADLRDPQHTPLKEVIQKRYPTYLEMVEAG